MISIEKNSNFYKMFCEFWNLQKKYIPILVKEGKMTKEVEKKLFEESKKMLQKYQKYGEYLAHMLSDFKIYFSKEKNISKVISFDKNSPIFQFFGEFWAYQKKYINKEMDNDSWEELIDSGKELIDKYPDFHSYCSAMILDFIFEMERIQKAA